MRTSFDQSTHDESNLLLRACEKLSIPGAGVTPLVGVNSRLRFLTSSSFVSPELRQAIVGKKVASIDRRVLLKKNCNEGEILWQLSSRVRLLSLEMSQNFGGKLVQTKVVKMRNHG